jgi:tetratricopeptide (TPR) repeat protein
MRPCIAKHVRPQLSQQTKLKIQALMDARSFERLLALCQRELTRFPNHPSLIHAKAIALAELDRTTEAISALHERFKSFSKPAWLLLARLYAKSGDTIKRKDILQRILAQDENCYEALVQLGGVLLKDEDYTEARNLLVKATKVNPDLPQAYVELANIASEHRQYKKAEQLLAKAAECGNSALSLKVRQFAAQGKAESWEGAEERYFELVKEPDLDIYKKFNLAQTYARFLRVHDRVDEAVALLESFESAPEAVQLPRINALALLYADRGDYDRAIGMFESLLEKHPDFISAKWNLSLIRITVGQVEQGFKEYEIRWQWKEFPSSRRKFDAPQWQGENLSGKSILVWREQGIGDEVRFGSLIQELESSGAQVTIESAPKLVKLFERAYPWAEVRAEGPRDCRGKEAYAGFDFQIPFGSLTTIYRKSINDFRRGQKPWLPRDIEKEQKLRSVMGLSPTDMLVGLCWRSSNRNASRNHLYAEVKDLITLKELKGVTFLNLQYDECTEELQAMRELGLPVKHISNINQKDNLLGASVLMGACDLVVTAGTAVLDIACAMGKPTIGFAPKGKSDVNMGEMDYPWTPTCLPLYFGEDQRALIPKVIMHRWPEIVKWAETKQKQHPPLALE